MPRPKPSPATVLLSQSRQIVSWLTALTPADFALPSALAGWDVRALTAHLVLVHTELAELMGQMTTAPPVPLHEFVRRFGPTADRIDRLTRQAGVTRPGPDLVQALSATIEDLVAAPDPAATTVIDTPRGATRLSEFLLTRVIEVVVHADDLSRSLTDREPVPLERPAVALCVRTLAQILAAQQPGRTIEVRVPPYAAVQCGLGEPGPTHTRGTPPNVVETDPLTFTRLATGRLGWADATSSGSVRASGLRADLSAALPLLC